MTSGGPSLHGRVALITGGTRGIGAAIAQEFERAGATVWVSDIEDHRLGSSLRGTSSFIKADLSVPAGIASLAEKLAGVTDRLDVLVNNAGVELPLALDELSPEVLDMTWAVNARAPVLLMRTLLPLLERSGSASVINMTSIHAHTPYAGNIAYCMTKAALEMSTRVAAIELASRSIRVNSLAPGAIETDINRDVLDQIGREKFCEWIPAGRVGDVDEIVAPALFLASDASRYMTGAALRIDGGYSLNLVRYRPQDIH